MYLRAAHAETDTAALHEFIRANPLGILTTAIPSPIYPLLQCSHIPWILDVGGHHQGGSDETDGSPDLGVLRGHIARQNPQAKAIIESLTSGTSSSTEGQHAQQLESEVMVLFNGPAHHYVTPKFYVETKPSTGKVVPTWNYTAAQAYGRATIYFDASSPETDAFLSRQVDDLSRYAETQIMDHRQQPWQVSDAPESYVRLLKKNIIGISIQIDRLEGKFKMSQEMGVGDREGIIQGFQGMGTDVGREIAETVRRRGELSDSMKKKK
jgi:predicted FMN-binding regulatory protein PaiB